MYVRTCVLACDMSELATGTPTLITDPDRSITVTLLEDV